MFMATDTCELRGATPPDLLMLGEVALRLHMPLWKLQDAFRRGLLAPPLRAGRYRVVPAERLPEIEAALRAAGRLSSAEAG
jgi:hypothetical protein